MIIFKKIIIKNFLSIGNSEIEIDLNSCKLKAFSGISGSGKSILLDAISYVLYNKAYRNIKKSQLINSLNSKDLLVKIWFSIGSDDYFIQRGMKPDFYEVSKNGSILDVQNVTSNNDYIESILRMNHRTFKQIVVLGASDFTSFMNLKPAERRLLIEKLLDIEVFAIMNKSISEDIKQNKIDLLSAQKNLDSINKQIELQEKSLISNAEDKKKVQINHQSDIDEYYEKINQLKQKLQVIPEKPEKKLKEFVVAKDKFKIKISQLNTRHAELEKRKQYYATTEICRTCSQKIDPKIQLDVLNECQEEMQKNREEYTKIFDAQGKLEKNIIKLEEIIKKINNIELLNRKIENEVSNYESKIEHLKKPFNLSVFDERRIQLQQSLDNLKLELETSAEEYNQISKTKELLIIAKELIGDSGVKTHIIDQYVPLINKYMNIFLNSMDFFVTFELDSEFNESIKSRGRDDFSYSSFSEGEKQRIDLAMLLTWRNISQSKNSLSTNLLILDEVFDSYLNLEATENVLEMFRSNFDNNTNIVVISHKEDILTKFDEVIYFKKENNFTLIEK